MMHTDNDDDANNNNDATAQMDMLSWPLGQSNQTLSLLLRQLKSNIHSV